MHQGFLNFGKENRLAEQCSLFYQPIPGDGAGDRRSSSKNSFDPHPSTTESLIFTQKSIDPRNPKIKMAIARRILKQMIPKI
ncbi:MAG: hypothetical protein HC799_08965 [Limnothrix sp. RL_2_0]|nr:hypothetical protein [Limnothrix sp. RL_2_0]